MKVFLVVERPIIVAVRIGTIVQDVIVVIMMGIVAAVGILFSVNSVMIKNLVTIGSNKFIATVIIIAIPIV